jgi:hypothetical protein
MCKYETNMHISIGGEKILMGICIIDIVESFSFVNLFHLCAIVERACGHGMIEKKRLCYYITCMLVSMPRVNDLEKALSTMHRVPFFRLIDFCTFDIDECHFFITVLMNYGFQNQKFEKCAGLGQNLESTFLNY